MSPVAETAIPSTFLPLLAQSPESRLESLEATHPEYAARSESWQVLLDAFEGSGGFLTGSYLWQYPAESDTDFTSRKAQARYHNYVETLIDLYVHFIFTQGVKRSSTNAEYDAWTQDVDGAGTDLNALLKRALSVGLLHGHGGILIDKTAEPALGPSVADEQARTIAVLYPATAIRDWRLTRQQLSAVKLLESVPAPSIVEEMPEGDDATQYLLWAEDGFARFTKKGKLIAAKELELGLVPLVVIRPSPSLSSAFLGRGLFGSANVVRALFNRASEEDEVLRRQSFSILTVSVPPEGDVERARDQIGKIIGSAKALVVQGTVDYKTPDQATTKSIRDNEESLVQELYRTAHVRFKRDSLASETAEAIRLQHSELNEILQGMAASLADVERQIARAWFAWQFQTVAQAEAAFEEADLTAEYPSEFFLDDLITDLEAWAEGIRMDLGDTMTKRIKKRAVRRIEPDIPPDELAVIDAEIDAQEEVTAPEALAVPTETPDEMSGEMSDEMMMGAAMMSGNMAGGTMAGNTMRADGMPKTKGAMSGGMNA